LRAAVYRTVRTVAWEVGHSNNGWPPTRLSGGAYINMLPHVLLYSDIIAEEGEDQKLALKPGHDLR